MPHAPHPMLLYLQLINIRNFRNGCSYYVASPIGDCDGVVVVVGGGGGAAAGGGGRVGRADALVVGVGGRSCVAIGSITHTCVVAVTSRTSG